MIVVDTSAIMAIVLNEPRALECEQALAKADAIIMSAGTLAEVLVVANGRGLLTDV